MNKLIDRYLLHLKKEAEIFPMIDLKSPLKLYINILKDMLDKGLAFCRKLRLRDAYILLYRLVIVALNILPKHMEYKYYKRSIKEYASVSLNALEQIKHPLINQYISQIKNKPNTLEGHLKKYDLVEVPVPGDGNCLLHSLSHQLEYHGVAIVNHKDLRDQSVNFLRKNSDVPMDDTDEVTLKMACGFFDDKSWSRYLKDLGRQSYWADQNVILAVCALYEVRVFVLSNVGYVHKIHTPNVWELGYNKTLYIIHIFESHYNSTKFAN